MPRYMLRWSVWLLLATAMLYVAPVPCGAQAAPPTPFCCLDLGHLGPSGGEVAAAAIGAGAVIGVGTYFLARAPRLTGCVVSQGGAMGLQGSAPGDPMYLLEGATGSLQVGERVKVVGRKHKNAGHQRVIHVSRVAKDYGQCSPVAAVRLPAPVAP